MCILKFQESICKEVDHTSKKICGIQRSNQDVGVWFPLRAVDKLSATILLVNFVVEVYFIDWSKQNSNKVRAMSVHMEM